MKIPYAIVCPGCKKTATVERALHEHDLDYRCPNCSQHIRAPLPLDMQAGFKLLVKSRHELIDRDDPTTSIVYSAAALDCDLSFRYFKWRGIDELMKFNEIGDEQLETEIRKFRTVDVKIEEVCRLLDPRGIEGFVAGDPELRDAIDNGFPSMSRGSLAKDFQRQLFWPRNRILHLGDTEKYKQGDAERCRNIARLGIQILHKMDYARRGKV